MPAEWTDAELEQISAYIDTQLDDNERTALEARLAQDADLRRELDAMRQTAALLRSLPMIRAPRAFTLTPEMLGQTAVPALALSESARVVPMPRARPLRRVWWVPAASAAGVVLLAGVFLISQTNNSGAPSTDAVGVAQVSTNTPSPALEGSAYNTVVQAVATQPPTAMPSEITAMKTDEQAPIPPASVVSTVDNSAPQTQVMAAPIQSMNTSELPTAAPSDPAYFVPTQDALDNAPRSQPIEMLEAMGGAMSNQPAATEESASDGAMILPSSMSAPFGATGGDTAANPTSILDAAAGGGPAQTTGAVAGMDGINTDPNAPGFTVATLSPQQGTAVAQYSTPLSDEIVINTSPQSAAPSDKRGMSLWLEWLNVLTNWLRVLFPGS